MSSIEIALRRHLDEGASADQIGAWLNNEGRVVLTITHASGIQSEFIAVDDKMVPRAGPYAKPPAQGVAISGFDAFKPMGGL